MELRAYFNILLRGWWIILLCVIVTLIAAFYFTSNQDVIYQGTASFVMRPRASLVQDQGDSVRILDTLGRGASIGSTYVEVATSRLIRRRAADSLGLSSQQREDLSVSGQAVAGTNLLKISVQGTDPALVRDYTNQIGAETVKYVGSLYDLFELEPLDAAITPRSPIKPSLGLNLALGVVLGYALGIGLTLFAAYLSIPQNKVRHFDIIDAETGAGNASYLRLRLRAEVSRARRTGHPFSLALIRITLANSAAEPVALHGAALLFQSRLREEDVLAYVGDAIFAVILPDTSGQVARELIEGLCIRVQTDGLAPAVGAKSWDVRCSAGVSSFQDGLSDADELWNQAALALDEASTSAYGKVALYQRSENLGGPSSLQIAAWGEEQRSDSV